MNPIIAQKVGITLPKWNNNRYQDNGKAILRTLDGRPINEFISNVREARIKNGSIDNVRNAIIFQNVGNTNVMINGNWTIKPGGVKMFGSSNNIDLNFQRYTYDFPADPNNDLGGNRLEIEELVLAELYTSSYQPKGIQLR